MTFGIVALILCAIFAVATVIYMKDGRTSWSDALGEGAVRGGFLAALVLVVWFVVAVPVSTYNRNNCKREADGYGLDYDWSIRNDCRIELPTGQLVPASKIRITSNGEIVAAS